MACSLQIDASGSTAPEEHSVHVCRDDCFAREEIGIGVNKKWHPRETPLESSPDGLELESVRLKERMWCLERRDYGAGGKVGGC